MATVGDNEICKTSPVGFLELNPTAILGDLDGKGGVTITDAIINLWVLPGDGTVGLDEVIYILQSVGELR
jgi:hypothetical protein